MKCYAFALALLLGLSSLAHAQDLAWLPVAGADAYQAVANGGTPIALNDPAVGADGKKHATLTLAPGTYDLAIQQRTAGVWSTCAAQITGFVVTGGTPPPPGTFQIAVASPAPASLPVGVSSTTGVSSRVTVTGKPVAYVEASFGLVGNAPTVFRCGSPATSYASCVQAGSDYTVTFKTGFGPGSRTLTFMAKATDGDAAKTPPQTVVVVP